jgi:hypothetical protein
LQAKAFLLTAIGALPKTLKTGTAMVGDDEERASPSDFTTPKFMLRTVPDPLPQLAAP